MKKIIGTISLILLCNSIIVGQNRSCDLIVKVLDPKQGDTIISPTNVKTLKFAVKNLGPDTIYPDDRFNFSLIVGNIAYFRGYYNFGDTLINSYDSITFGMNVKFDFPITTWSEICGMPYGIITPCKTCSSVNIETGKAEKNNRACNSFYHLSFVSTAFVTPSSINQLYPNPILNECLLQVSNGYSINANIVVRNLSGQLISVPRINEIDGIRLNFNNFPAGCYYIYLIEGGQFKIFKALKI